MNSPLKVYKASAGSGKTFTLAVEYIKLLIEEPSAYRHILAVTFTNKATAEMKERILSQLYGISTSHPDSESYFGIISKHFPTLSGEEIRRRAGTALGMMLSDYNRFRVETIDAFFQTILRGLARELDLSGDVTISLDSEKLLNEAIDQMITKLTPTSEEMGWLVEYITEHLSNNDSWKIDKGLKEFAKNILSEEYQERGERLREQLDADKGAILADFRKKLAKIEKEILDEAESLGKQFHAIAAANNLTADDFFQKKNGVWSYFTKLQNRIIPGENKHAANSVFSPKKLTKKEIPAIEYDKIVVLYNRAEEMRINDLSRLTTSQLSVMRLHQLRLLNTIARALQEENNKENRFLLAQTTFLLSKMITGNTSFIYEKTGTEIQHIFIDEFQDTSILQWKNFKVLLEETISNGNTSLIVGDVKQSIYRWRNSDWSILNNLEKEFPHYNVKPDTLKTNRRSERRVIEFNNALFTEAAEQISLKYNNDLGASSKELVRAYSDVSQEILPDKPDRGYAEVRFIKKEEEKNLKESICAQLMQTLDTLINHNGVKPSNIAILVRTNDEITMIAEEFTKHFPGHTIISDDAFLLSSSTALQMIISTLRHLTDPDDKVNTAFLAMRYADIRGTEAIPAKLTSQEYIDSLLPAEYTRQRDILLNTPLYELIEKIIDIFSLHTIEGEAPYIYTFLDLTAKYLKDNPAAPDSFITYWDEEMYKKSIPSVEGDGVRILSIHKSKGLEFHTVIIPFCTWEFIDYRHTKTLWCVPNEEPFNTISLLPIDFKKAMLDSIYHAEYNHEYLYQLVDNLNILYVACTRAGKNLIIFTGDTGSTGDIMYKRLLPIIKNISLPGATYDEEGGIFTYGEIVPSGEKKKEESNKKPNPFLTRPQAHFQKFNYHERSPQFRQSRSLRRFLANEEGELQTLENIARGELLHELLSRLRTGNELQRELLKMQLEGLIATDKERAGIEKLITGALSNPTASDWFSGRYKLYNECAILDASDSKESRRPDRVMTEGEKAIVVDFKFGTPRSYYKEQVQGYMDKLKRMGYTQVSGYLWYIYNNNIEEV